ncbi:MAG: glycoside hydrolase family 16 protein [Clostridia bacterium]|nr:glycoside hydrolase family 16 protein [Clostridia bacterium]
MKHLFDKFINRSIDLIHRGIVVYRAKKPYKNTNKLDLSKFTLTFEDHFDGDTLNSEVWTHFRQGERKGGYWDAGQAFLRDGNLVIRTEYKEGGRYGPGWYCDRIDTRRLFEQKYGYFECRCILPAAQGLWSAFWLSSEKIGDFVPGRNGTEIDVFESPLWHRILKKKENDLITSNLHYGGYGAGHRYKNVAVAKANDPYRQYNTYGVEWNEEGYIFYVNGRETGRSRFGGVSEAPEYLLLSVEIDGVGGKPFPGWSGEITNNAPGTFPVDFVVDYVRAYRYRSVSGDG